MKDFCDLDGKQKNGGKDNAEACIKKETSEDDREPMVMPIILEV